MDKSAQQPVNVPIQSTPVSIAQKEQAGGVAVDGETEVIIRSSEIEPQLSKEVAAAGVERIAGVTPVPPEAVKVGVKLAREATPVVTQPTGLIQLPVPEEEAKRVVRTNGNVSNSALWQAIAVIRQIKRHVLRMHEKLKGEV